MTVGGRCTPGGCEDARIRDLLPSFSFESRGIINRALEEATAMGKAGAGSEHLLLALLAAPSGWTDGLLVKSGMSYSAVRNFVAGMTSRSEKTDPPTIAEDLVGVLKSAMGTRPIENPSAPVRPRDLLLAVAQMPGPITEAVFQSYAIKPQLIVEGLAAEASAGGASPGKPRGKSPTETELPLPTDLAKGSPLAQSIVRKALLENWTIDGFVCVLLTLEDSLRARVSLTLRALDADSGEIAEMIASDAPSLVGPKTSRVDDDLMRAMANISTRWLQRTGDQHPDTLHLLLAAIGSEPRGAAARALKTYGVTSDLLVSAGMGVRPEIGLDDKPGGYAHVTDGSSRGPSPKTAPTQREPLAKLPGVRLRRRLFRGSTPSGDNLNSDLEMTRLKRWTVATTLNATSAVMFAIMVCGSAIASGSWWPILAIPLAGAPLELVPVPACVVAWSFGMCLVPWPARVALAAVIASRGLSTWIQLQWRRSDTADPTFNLARYRRDSWTSFRSLFLGGSS